MKKYRINVCGCALADNLYTGIDFHAPALAPFMSKKPGDGGISPGRLVFAEDLETFAKIPYNEIKKHFSVTGEPDARNLGGPAVVGAICASQLLYAKSAGFHFFGVMGTDSTGDFIHSIVTQTPVDITHYQRMPGNSPCTDVLSDPNFHDGKGERSFLNRIGIASEFGVKQLGDAFFEGDILWFSATALVPQLHDNLTSLLKRGKSAGKINVVSTVFDFRNEKKNPGKSWPLGENTKESYPLIDLLIVDCEEALRLSGTDNISDAAGFFINSGVSAFFITHGAKDFLAWSDGEFFTPLSLTALPVSAAVLEELAAHPERRGDTTGCGDNFAGGLLASVVEQLMEGASPGKLDPLRAAAWAASAGGAACFHAGGTYLEKFSGEKRAVIEHYASTYPEQLKKTGIN